MNKFEENAQKMKGWVKKHAKGICLASVTIIGGTVLALVHSMNKSDDTNVSEEDSTPIEYGRECTMKFIVDETGEELGEAKCYESFVNDMIGHNEDLA